MGKRRDLCRGDTKLIPRGEAKNFVQWESIGRKNRLLVFGFQVISGADNSRGPDSVREGLSSMAKLTNPFASDAISYAPGDWVVYRKQKRSASPGPRAESVRPASRGESYNYFVDKYWVVEQVLSEDKLRLRTRRGKEHIVPIHDPRLRKARWWERLMHRNRFQLITAQDDGSSPTSTSGSSTDAARV